MKDDDVPSIPLRAELPLEIAALALPQEDDEAPRVVLNAAEPARETFSLFRPDVYIPALWGSAIYPVARWARDHQVAATAITTVAVSSAVLGGLNTALDGESRTITQQPPTVTITVLASESATGRPTPSRTTTPQPSPRPEMSPAPVLPARTGPPSATPASHPTATKSRKPAPTGTPTRDMGTSPDPTPPKSPAPSPTGPPPVEDPPLADDSPGATTPPPAAEPPPEAADPTVAARDCVIRVDLDPLLNACVLS